MSSNSFVYCDNTDSDNTDPNNRDDKQRGPKRLKINTPKKEKYGVYCDICELFGCTDRIHRIAYVMKSIKD